MYVCRRRRRRRRHRRRRRRRRRRRHRHHHHHHHRHRLLQYVLTFCALGTQIDRFAGVLPVTKVTACILKFKFDLFYETVLI